jgi:hypothetical protein
MFVLVSAADGGPRAELREAGDLKRLHVEFRQVDDAAGAAALAAGGFGTVADGHAWLDIGALRRAGEDTEDWPGQFEAMVGYARHKGWTDAAGERLRAHIERT